MADVEISYGGSTIVSMNDSGAEVLETNGKFMTDDITVAYTSPGGGGGSTLTAELPLSGLHLSATLYYVDDTGTYQAVGPNEPGSPYTTTWYATLPVGSIVVLYNNSKSLPASGTNLVKKSNIVNASSHKAAVYLVEAT